MHSISLQRRSFQLLHGAEYMPRSEEGWIWWLLMLLFSTLLMGPAGMFKVAPSLLWAVSSATWYDSAVAGCSRCTWAGGGRRAGIDKISLLRWKLKIWSVSWVPIGNDSVHPLYVHATVFGLQSSTLPSPPAVSLSFNCSWGGEGRSLWVFLCRESCWLVVKPLEHTGQARGLTCECDHLWTFKCEARRKPLPQPGSSQTNGLSFVCERRCCSNKQGLEYIFPHPSTEHRYFFGRLHILKSSKFASSSGVRKIRRCCRFYGV